MIELLQLVCGLCLTYFLLCFGVAWFCELINTEKEIKKRKAEINQKIEEIRKQLEGKQ